MTEHHTFLLMKSHKQTFILNKSEGMKNRVWTPTYLEYNATFNRVIFTTWIIIIFIQINLLLILYLSPCKSGGSGGASKGRKERKKQTQTQHSISQTKQSHQNTKMFAMTNTATTCTGTSLRWQQQPHFPPFNRRHRQPVTVSFKNNNNKPNDMDRVLKEAWQNANDGFERLLFEAKKTAERIDRQYSVSKRFASVASAAADRAREIDRDFEIGVKYRNFSSDFALNWPRVSYFLCFFFFFFFFFFFLILSFLCFGITISI